MNGKVAERKRSINDKIRSAGSHKGWNKTIRSGNGKNNSAPVSMHPVEIGHGQQAVFLFKALGEIRRTGEAGIEGDLRNGTALLLHKFLGFFEPEFLEQYIRRHAGKHNGFAV